MYRNRALDSIYSIFLGILIMISGLIGFYFLVVGVIFAGISWLIFIFPDLLETYRISVLGEQIIDPSHVFLPLFTSGLILIAVGLIPFGIFYAMIYRFKPEWIPGWIRDRVGREEV